MRLVPLFPPLSAARKGALGQMWLDGLDAWARDRLAGALARLWSMGREVKGEQDARF